MISRILRLVALVVAIFTSPPSSRSLSWTSSSAVEARAVERLGAVQVEHHVVALQRGQVRLEAVGLVLAEFLGRMDHDHVAEDFGGQVHGQGRVVRVSRSRSCCGSPDTCVASDSVGLFDASAAARAG